MYISGHRLVFTPSLLSFIVPIPHKPYSLMVVKDSANMLGEVRPINGQLVWFEFTANVTSAALFCVIQLVCLQRKRFHLKKNVQWFPSLPPSSSTHTYSYPGSWSKLLTTRWSLKLPAFFFCFICWWVGGLFCTNLNPMQYLLCLLLGLFWRVQF